MDVLYNDCDPAFALELNKYMTPHALLAFESKAAAPAWADEGFNGRRAYVRTLEDCCNPSSLQDLWIAKSKVEWNVVDFKTGHMPFESQPEALAAQVVKFINDFSTMTTQSARVGAWDIKAAFWRQFASSRNYFGRFAERWF